MLIGNKTAVVGEPQGRIEDACVICVNVAGVADVVWRLDDACRALIFQLCSCLLYTSDAADE